MASEASNAFVALERDIGAPGVEAAALRLARVEAGVVRAFLQVDGEVIAIEVQAVAERLSGVPGVEAGRSWSC